MFQQVAQLALLTLLLTLKTYGQTAGKPAHQTQWEYKTVHSDSDLNQLVNSGWEFVSMASDRGGQHYLLSGPAYWSRIGTDITNQGPFNATFSLTGTTVPEPGSLILLGSALMRFGLIRRRAR